MYKKLESLGFFEWLDKVHNLVDTDMKPEYLDRLPLDDIHRTVCNAMAFRWFREKYADVLVKDYGLIPHFTMIQNMFLDSNKIWTYEEAESACIDKLLELAKQQ